MDPGPGENPAHIVRRGSADIPLSSSVASGPTDASPNTNVSRPAIHPPQFRHKLERKDDVFNNYSEERCSLLEKQNNFLLKQSKSKDRKIRKLEGDIDELKDQIEKFFTLQKDQNIKTRREFSSLRREIEQHISQTQKYHSETRTDIGELRSRMTQNAQIGLHSAASAHVMMTADTVSHLFVSTSYC
jgi:ElaB/YqjD/DUF883 family membrane-anchored ribosome-binding protein